MGRALFLLRRSRKGAIKVRSIRLIAIFVGLALLSWSQAGSTSQVSGTVQDASGAAIPGALVKLTKTETGSTRTVSTAGDGSYLIPSLAIGPYEMEVSKQGFSTSIAKDIILNVNTNPIINATLKVGAISDRVEVVGSALSVETHSTGVGQVIDHQEVTELPLNSRDPTQLILLVGN